jgi:hypothetical protein
MKFSLKVLIIFFTVAVALNASQDPKVYQRNPDEFLWRLSIEGDNYSLSTIAMTGERCFETGIIEKNNGSLRFIPKENPDCPFPRVLEENWFVVIQREGTEYLVEEERIADFNQALSQPSQLWFDYFERVKGEQVAGGDAAR